MMVRLVSCVAVTSLLVLGAATAHAATLQGLQGVVLVDRGGGFSVVRGPTSLSVGDAVIANPGGSARIVYPDGCQVSVRPGDVVATMKKSPCNTNNSAQAAPEPEDSSSGFDTTTMVIGAAAIGIGVGAAVFLLSDDDPASP